MKRPTRIIISKLVAMIDQTTNSTVSVPLKELSKSAVAKIHSMFAKKEVSSAPETAYVFDRGPSGISRSVASTFFDGCFQLDPGSRSLNSPLAGGQMLAVPSGKPSLHCYHPSENPLFFSSRRQATRFRRPARIITTWSWSCATSNCGPKSAQSSHPVQNYRQGNRWRNARRHGPPTQSPSKSVP